MIHYLLLLLTTTALTQASARQENQKNVDPQEIKPLLFIVERSQTTPQQQNEKKESARQQAQQGFESNLQFGGFPFLEPQFQYPGFNQQSFPRVQPSIYLYGPGGHGQPILINPGSPPGNFLVPQPYPGPNVRDTPQQRPFFVGGYPNPKPAHIPPIEKDAEEIPTNPAKIPPLESTPKATKPEKLETFNEGKNEYPFKPAGEADVLAAADKNPQFINTNALRPGHRFFILNGNDLFQNYPNVPNYPGEANVGLKYAQQPDSQYQQPEVFQKQQLPLDINSLLVQTLLVRPSTGETIPNSDLNPEQRFHPSPEEQFPPIFNPPNPQIPQDVFFRSSLQQNDAFGQEGAIPVGQFRFTPPNGPYYPLDGEDIENDSIIVDAKIEDGSMGENGADNVQTEGPRPDKSEEPGMAQASPGAIALAGPGGVAGASPRATSIVGKGGVAVSNPQATAVAGTKKEADKDEKDKKLQRKFNK
nr:uncharacterized protein LOC111504876 [Leptinotarsa decemlineata]